jgi:hypothetical protein
MRVCGLMARAVANLPLMRNREESERLDQCATAARPLDLPVGQINEFAVQPPSGKIFLFFRNPNQRYIRSHPVPEEGRWPSSRTLGRDAVDAGGATDESAGCGR